MVPVLVHARKRMFSMIKTTISNIRKCELRQLEYLMSRARDIKIRGRADFEDDFDEIKDLISAKTLVTVDDHITKLEDVKKKVSDRRDTLRQKATDEKLIDDTSSVDIADRY